MQRLKDKKMEVAERPKLEERHCLAVYGKVWVGNEKLKRLIAEPHGVIPEIPARCFEFKRLVPCPLMGKRLDLDKALD